MQRAHGAPTPNRKRRRSRAAGVLAALTVSACLTVPFTGAAAQALSATPAPLPLTDIPTVADDIPSAFGLRGTAADWWSTEVASRAELVRNSTVEFGDASVEVPSGRTTAINGMLVPPMNLNLPFVFGVPGSPQSAPIESRYVSPVPGPVTSPFGPRFHPILHYVRSHNGVDMTAACGTPVVAMADGVVTRSANAGGYGLLIEIDHGTLDEDRMSSRSAHLSVLGVKVGQRVLKGQQIGLAGTTGLSTGCHLHFEVLINGAYVDPVAVLTGSPYVRLDTPMVPWTPGTRPSKPALPSLEELPLVPAKPTPKPTPSATPTPVPTPTPSPSTPPVKPPVTADPLPDATPSPTSPPPPRVTITPRPPVPSPTPEPTPEPEPQPEPTAAPSPQPAPTTPAAPAPTPAAPEPTASAAPEPTASAAPEPTASAAAPASPAPSSAPTPEA